MFKYVLPSALLASFASTMAYGADMPAASTLPETLVTASLYPATPADLASSVSIISREEIEKRNPLTVEELLRDVPGLTVTRNGSFGQTSRVLIRGADARHTLVMIDGTVVNDPSDPGNAYDFAYLTPDNIERIEVLRGPQSMLYGSDAIGGVINIITASGSGKPRVFGSAEYGSYNTRKVTGGSSGSINNINYSFAASRAQSGGFSSFDTKFGGVDDDGIKDTAASANVSAKLSEKFTANFTGRVTDGLAEYDDFGADAANRANSRQWSGRTSGVLDLFDGKWQQELGVDGTHLRRTNVSSFGDNYFQGNRQKIDWLHHLKFIANHVLSVGTSFSREDAKGDTFDSHAVNTKAVYVEDQYKITKAFFTTFGVRMDNHSQFGSEVTYRISPSYTIAQTGTKLKANYGTAFKAPSLYQLYSIFGFRDLNPEKSKGFDVGFEQSFRGNFLTIGSSYFHNNISQLIDYDFATNHYLNVGEVTTRGFESFIAVKPFTGLTLNLNHTYLLAEDETTNQQLVRRPKHSANFTADYQVTDAVNVGFNANLVGRRNDIDLSFSRTELPSHSTLGAYANWKIQENVTLYARLDNALDKRYEELYGYGTPRLSAYGGIKINY